MTVPVRPTVLRVLGVMLLVGIFAAQPLRAGPIPSAMDTQRIFSGVSQDPYTLALRATIWGLPAGPRGAAAAEGDTVGASFCAAPADDSDCPDLGHARDLAGPHTRIGVAPNNDTLYSLAFLDMQDGPFQLETPDFKDRYYIFQFGDADSETRQSYGQSSHGGRLPPIFIVGPDYRGPVSKGAKVVRSAQRYLMVAGRILVGGAKDLPNIHRLRDSIKLRKWLARDCFAQAPLSFQRRLSGEASGVPEGLKLLADLGSVMEDWHASHEDAGLIASMRGIGLTVENGFSYAQLAPNARAAIERGVADGLAIIREKNRHLGTLSGGWSTSYAGSRFDGDYLLRAAVAMDQIYVLDKDEALYPVAHLDAQGRQLDGQNSYILCFRKQDLPPVNAFWSISLYYEKGFLAANPIDRHSIGDRTPGLTYGPDGSLRLFIQNADPGPNKRANWLPAPREPFMLMMRLYRPKATAVSSAWHPPAIELVDATYQPDSTRCAAR